MQYTKRIWTRLAQKDVCAGWIWRVRQLQPQPWMRWVIPVIDFQLCLEGLFSFFVKQTELLPIVCSKTTPFMKWNISFQCPSYLTSFSFYCLPKAWQPETRLVKIWSIHLLGFEGATEGTSYPKEGLIHILSHSNFPQGTVTCVQNMVEPQTLQH